MPFIKSDIAVEGNLWSPTVNIIFRISLYSRGTAILSFDLIRYSFVLTFLSSCTVFMGGHVTRALLVLDKLIFI